MVGSVATFVRAEAGSASRGRKPATLSELCPLRHRGCGTGIPIVTEVPAPRELQEIELERRETSSPSATQFQLAGWLDVADVRGHPGPARPSVTVIDLARIGAEEADVPDVER